ncbi:hypothetical protein GUJ93_ZPchr0010g7689 [Zizania palustris]|uniref:Uncharacterized protein n=1 Tax=Zizania palustris TaxID=103762 RepID=A0A8J5WF47_ZIZPA|nr:hypothetical protein GUJ93_ZPchr0010g7689 [Zizania palustris]
MPKFDSWQLNSLTTRPHERHWKKKLMFSRFSWMSRTMLEMTIAVVEQSIKTIETTLGEAKKKTIEVVDEANTSNKKRPISAPAREGTIG